MITWIIENIGTISVTIILIALVALITRKMIKDKRNGKTSCGCGCSSCSNCSCHKNI